MLATAAKYRKTLYTPIPGPADGEIRINKQSIRQAVEQLAHVFEVSFHGRTTAAVERRIAFFMHIDSYVVCTFSHYMQRDKKEVVVVSGLAQAFATVVAAAEVVKRRIPGLHQVSSSSPRVSGIAFNALLHNFTHICDLFRNFPLQITRLGVLETSERYEPLEEGLDTVLISRKLSTLYISLTLKPTPEDRCCPGYQGPLPAAEVFKELDIGQFAFDEFVPSLSVGHGKATAQHAGSHASSESQDNSLRRTFVSRKDGGSSASDSGNARLAPVPQQRVRETSRPTDDLARAPAPPTVVDIASADAQRADHAASVPDRADYPRNAHQQSASSSDSVAGDAALSSAGALPGQTAAAASSSRATVCQPQQQQSELLLPAAVGALAAAADSGGGKAEEVVSPADEPARSPLQTTAAGTSLTHVTASAASSVSEPLRGEPVLSRRGGSDLEVVGSRAEAEPARERAGGAEAVLGPDAKPAAGSSAASISSSSGASSECEGADSRTVSAEDRSHPRGALAPHAAPVVLSRLPASAPASRGSLTAELSSFIGSGSSVRVVDITPIEGSIASSGSLTHVGPVGSQAAKCERSLLSHPGPKPSVTSKAERPASTPAMSPPAPGLHAPTMANSGRSYASVLRR